MKKKSKSVIILIIILGLVAIGVAVVFLLIKPGENPDSISSPEFKEPIYSKLSGLEITDTNLNSAPTYCIQIPNGSTDGARPQVGLNQAAVVFEAIAETGITRFAAIFQNPMSSVLGPIRSLRPYYLDWDTPFDCTVVHDGGSDEALAAIASGGQRNLDENFAYMWRDGTASRLWNNVFTSPSLLNNFASDKGYTTSNPKVFPRLAPEEAALEVLKARENTAEEVYNYISDISITFSGYADYNTFYTYDPITNTYPRSFQTGDQHLVYNCPDSINQYDIAGSCNLSQVAPSAIVAMMVRESTMSDNYHESITTIGSGKAYIFQNGQIVEATWTKKSQKDQIVFTDASGNIISFTPGQLWIAAVPQFGSVRWGTLETTNHYTLEEK